MKSVKKNVQDSAAKILLHKTTVKFKICLGKPGEMFPIIDNRHFTVKSFKKFRVPVLANGYRKLIKSANTVM